MSFLDPITAGGPAAELGTTGAPVDVEHASPPTAGQVLTATDATHATWQTPSGGGGGGGDGGNAGGLQTTGDPVDVSASSPPVAGQVLYATDSEHAIWRVPGLKYDPSIKFWSGSSGEATIEPGTWGFVEAPAGGTDPVTVFVVSSLEQPPVDSRFGLYVGRDVTVPVQVSLIGASQIQGLDGELASSIALLPGADYEWVFYHEAGAAVWGLVSDTAGVAKRIAVSGGYVDVMDSDPPVAGQVLTAIDETHAAFQDPVAVGGLTYAGESTSPSVGTWCLVNGSPVNLPSDAVVGDSVGMLVRIDYDGAALHIPSEFELAIGNQVLDSSQPLTLRGGAYYEWTLQTFGESNRWMPRGMSNEQPAPLARRSFGVIYPNEWVLTSDYSGVVNMPAAPQDGDSFAVYVNTEGASLIPDTGDKIEAPDGTDTVTGPAALTLPGATYYEWIWTSGDSTWHPRQNYLILRAAAIYDAIATDGTTSVFSVGNKRIASVLDPVNPQDAATKNYSDTAALGFTRVQTALAAASGPVSVNSQKLTNVADPTAAQDAATKSYADTLIALLGVKPPVRTVSTTNITLSGLQTVSAVALAANDRVLVAGQSTGSQNGPYLAQTGAWTRAPDADTSAKIKGGQIIIINEGTFADTAWFLTNNDPITLGTTALVYTPFGGLKASSAPVDVIAGQSANAGSSNRWAQEDHVHTLQAPHQAINGFRLSTNNTSSMPTAGSFSFVYLVPHTGNRIALSNNGGSNFYPVPQSSILSVAISAAAGIPVDIFANFVSLTSTALVATPWTNATTRATPIVQVNGVWCKSGSQNQRYLGTVLADGATGFTVTTAGSGSTKAVAGLWNQDNRIKSTYTWAPTVATWSPSLAATWEPLGGGSGPHIELVVGQGIDDVNARAIAAVDAGTAGAALGIGFDSTNTPSGFRHSVSGSGMIHGLTAMASQKPAAGRKTVNMLGYGSSVVPVFQGASGAMAAGLELDLWH